MRSTRWSRCSSRVFVVGLVTRHVSLPARSRGLSISDRNPAIVMSGGPRSHPPGDSASGPVVVWHPPTGGADWPARLGRPDGGRPAGQDAVELVAGADVELGEDLAQVVLDRSWTDEQPGADLRVGESVAGEPGDLGPLGGQLVPGLDGALADSLAGGQELAPGPLGEPLDAHRRQHLVGGEAGSRKGSHLAVFHFRNWYAGRLIETGSRTLRL